MPIPVICPSCKNNISAPDHVAGRTLRCFKCLNPFTVPNVTPTPAPIAPMAQLAPSFAAAPAAFVAEPAGVPEPARVAAAPDGFALAGEPQPFAPVPAPELPPLPGAVAPAVEDDPFLAAAMLEAEPPPPPAPDASDPFELVPPANGEAAGIMSPMEELPSTEDMPTDVMTPTDETPMELSATDEVEAPMEDVEAQMGEVEAPMEEMSEEPEKSKKSKLLAALLAFFLPFSIHRFYLGYTKSAILQAILWFVLIGAIWQFFDFLRLLLGIGFKKDGSGAPFK